MDLLEINSFSFLRDIAIGNEYSLISSEIWPWQKHETYDLVLKISQTPETLKFIRDLTNVLVADLYFFPLEIHSACGAMVGTAALSSQGGP